MNLSGLLFLLNEIPAYRHLVDTLQKSEHDGQSDGLLPHPRTASLSLIASARPYLTAALQQDLGRPILVVAVQPERARQIYDELRVWSATSEDVLRFPEPDALPYERVPWAIETIGERLAVLAALSSLPSPLFPVFVRPSHYLMMRYAEVKHSDFSYFSCDGTEVFTDACISLSGKAPACAPNGLSGFRKLLLPSLLPAE